MLRIVIAVLLLVLALLQYRLWVSSDGMREVWQLQDAVDVQRHENATLRERNQALEAEVRDLKEGLNAVEERARTELGMTRRDETFYQIVTPATQGDPGGAESH